MILVDGDGGHLPAALGSPRSSDSIFHDGRAAEALLLLVANPLPQLLDQRFIPQAFDAQAFQLRHVFLEVRAVFLGNAVVGERARIVGRLDQTKVKVFIRCSGLGMGQSETEQQQEEICWHGRGLDPAG